MVSGMVILRNLNLSLLLKIFYMQWITSYKQMLYSWLTRRKQRVIVDDSASAWTPVKSGVPQGTVLGPLMFLIYINDIGDKVSSNLWLFADDCILYSTVTSLEDSKQLQCDLDSISEWSQLWQILQYFLIYTVKQYILENVYCYTVLQN